MDTVYYLDKFQKSVDLLDGQLFSQHQLEIKVGVWLNSVALKIQKGTWLGNPKTGKPFESSVFFSIWVNDTSLEEGRINHNIHALNLRQLPGYRIKSRGFAEAFRSAFKPFEKDWPNVSTQFGPQTLMEGWVKIDADIFENVVPMLSNQFLEISFVIDGLLAERAK